MGKWLILFVLFLFVLTSSSWVYLYSGLREYSRANEKIISLDGNEQLIVENYLNGSEQQNRYTGILGGVMPKYEIVWTWGKQGPKIFKMDKETVLTKWSACSPVIKQKMANGDPVMLTSQIYPNMDEWSKQVGRGDYIEVLVAGEGEIVPSGTAREVIVHDWWVFLPPEMGVQCAR